MESTLHCEFVNPSNPNIEPLGEDQSTEGDKDCPTKGLILDFFSGKGRLSLACRQAGLRSLPIDKDPKKS